MQVYRNLAPQNWWQTALPVRFCSVWMETLKIVNIINSQIMIVCPFRVLCEEMYSDQSLLVLKEKYSHIISELKIGFKRILMPSLTDILVGLSDVFWIMKSLIYIFREKLLEFVKYINILKIDFNCVIIHLYIAVF